MFLHIYLNISVYMSVDGTKKLFTDLIRFMNFSINTGIFAENTNCGHNLANTANLELFELLFITYASYFSESETKFASLALQRQINRILELL